jgi:hypothetical protein
MQDDFFGQCSRLTSLTEASVVIILFFIAANFVLLPLSYLGSSRGEGSRSPLADCSLLVLLVLIHYHKCVVSNESVTQRIVDSATSDSLLKENTYFSDNPYCKALEKATDFECKIRTLIFQVFFFFFKITKAVFGKSVLWLQLIG